MSVSRSIQIRLVTNKVFSDLLKDLVGDRWIWGKDGMIHTIAENDLDLFDFIAFNNFADVKLILDNREKKGLSNFILLWDSKIEECYYLSCHQKSERYDGYKNHYELSILFDGFKRIEKANRYTDFGYYLNGLIPRLIEINCYVCEITCHDFDS